MTGVTNAELASAIQQVIAQVDAREDQLLAWQAGDPNGGPYGDGRYGITNLLGETKYFKSPARLQYEVDLLTTAGTGAVAAAEAARDAAQAAEASATTKSENAAGSASLAATKASEADGFRQLAAGSEANAAVHRQAAEAAAAAAGTDAQDLAQAVADAAASADASATQAGLSDLARVASEAARDEAAGYAASINPSQFATPADIDAKIAEIIDQAPDTLNTLNEIAAALGDDPNFATTVTNELAGKAPIVHSHGISDVTGLQTALDAKSSVGHSHGWSEITGKPSTFTPSSHTHAISQVTGLQAALDGKQPVGSYSVDGHTHDYLPLAGGTISGGLTITKDSYDPLVLHRTNSTNNVTIEFRGMDQSLYLGLAGGALRVGAAPDVLGTGDVIWHSGNFNPASKADASHSHSWTSITGKPSTFTPTAHTHAIADVTGLQAALDGKQAAGSYAAASHSHSEYLARTGGSMGGLITSTEREALRFQGWSDNFISWYNSAGSTREGYIQHNQNGAFVLRNEVAGGDVSVLTSGGAFTVDGRNVLSEIDGKASTGHTHTFNDIAQASQNSWSSLRLQNSYGYIDFGPANASYAHIYTDRSEFYFNRDLRVNGQQVFHNAYHPNADKLTTARTISLGGDLSGSVSFDGSSNVTLSAQVADDSHSHTANYPLLEDQKTLQVTTAGWVTIAEASTARAYGEFYVWDTDSGRHNFVKIIASTAFGQNQISVEHGCRYGIRTIAHARILYDSANRTYNGAKLQVYCENPTWWLSARALLRTQFNGWSMWTPITPVLEDTPAGWVEDVRVEDITSRAYTHTGTFRGPLTGNADTATKLATARTISLTGDVTGSASFDGSGNVSISAVVADDSHAHTIANVDGLQAALNAKLNSATPTISSGPLVNTAAQSRDKLRVWTSAPYSIGMQTGYTFGALNNNYAMSFQMNNDSGRGFWWGDDAHTNAQGAMALTTNGRLTVATSLRLGYGEADNVVPTSTLDVNGSVTSNGGVVPYHGNASYGSAKMTVSTAAPSGGTDGDIWFQV